MKAFFSGRFGKLTGIVVIIAAALTQFVAPFPAQAWWKSYDSGYHDAGYGVAIDSNGNVIVAGYRRTSNPAEYNNSYAVKYDSLGNYVCEISVSGPVGANAASDGFNGVTVDSQDNIVLAGTISGTFSDPSYYLNAMYLNKYAPDCDPVWAQPVMYQYQPGSSTWQDAQSVVVGALDNIYITGRTFDWGTQGDWITLKYNSAGVLQSGFPILYNFSNSLNYQDYAFDVAVDSLGNIIVVGVRGVSDCGGTSCVTNNLDWHVRKYNASGTTLIWEDTYSGGANLYDYAYRVTVDSQDNPIVAGYTNKGTNNTTNADFDWLVIKYAANGVALAGQRVWQKTFESASGKSEAAYAVAVNENDNVIVGGSVQVDATTSNGRLATLNGATGSLIYEKMITDPANVYPMRLAYRVGAVAVGGYVWDPAGTNNNMYAALLEIDGEPDSFAFTDRTDVELNTVVESDEITVTGIDADSAISITGGEYSVDSGDYASTAGFVTEGQTVQVRQTSSSSYSTPTNATLTIGGVSDIFSVTTIPDPPPETTASPGEDIYRTAIKVTLSTNEPATIYYTTNGATPVLASRKYSGPISIATNTTLKFFGVDTAGSQENVHTEYYFFDTVPPKNGTFTIAPVKGEQKFYLSWDTFDDGTGSGVKEYWLVVGTSGSLPCTTTGAARISTAMVREHTTGTLQLNKTYYYRACASDYVGNVSTGAMASKKVLPEYDPPTDGSIIIHGNPGDAYTKTAAVTLELSATDPSVPLQMCVSNGATCTSWVVFATTKTWTLLAGSGEKTVNVWFRDKHGNASATPYSDTIFLDTTKPVDGTLSIAPGLANTTFELSWAGFSDALSGLKDYKLVVGTAGYPACTAAALSTGTGTSFSHEGRTLGLTYYYRVCATDNVGNVSAGATASKKVLPEYDPPTGGSVVITGKDGYTFYGDDIYTRNASVTLSLTAPIDEHPPLQMCVSNGATCTSWVAFAATKTWTLTPGSGLKTVNVWFRDMYGNATAAPVSGTIFLDTTKPVDGTLTIAPGLANTTFELSWTGFSDALSGLNEYWLAIGTAGYPACTSEGDVGMDTTYTQEGLTPGKTYYYKVCAQDNVGNVSAGATASKKVLPEYDPPTGGSVVINGKDTYVNGSDSYTRYAAVTLTIGATGATQICMSNGNTCTSWVAFATTKTWTLSAGSGLKTVKVWFRDSLGNVSAPSSDTIYLDMTKPVDGTISIAMGELDLTFDVSWKDFHDDLSGLWEYWLTIGTSGYPACNEAGDQGLETTYKHEGLTYGKTYYYRVCAVDWLGNISTGATAQRKMQ